MGLVGGVLGFCLGLPIGLAAAYFVYLRYFAAARRLQAADYRKDMLVQIFKKPLEPPLVLSAPRTRVTRARTDEELIPKRSARLAAKSMHREPKPEAQARKVLMRRLGVEIENGRPDEASFLEFQSAFATPLPEATREAMNILFPGRKQRTLTSVSAA